MTNDDCRRIGLERCGTDVSCSLCVSSSPLLAPEPEYLVTPYFDIDGNEGTLDEVQSSQP